MQTSTKKLVILAICLNFVPFIMSTIVKEFCLGQQFSMQCLKGQVILMETALYGRMRLGKCIQTNERLGCSVDVLRTMDSVCSGRRNCTGAHSDMFFQGLECGEMVPYLETSYTCLGGNASLFNPTLNDLARCGTDQPIPVTSPKQGYILGGTDTKDCPIRIHALAGQTIQIFLYDFGGNDQTDKTSYRDGGSIDYGHDNSHIYKGGHISTTIAERYASLTDRFASGHTMTVTSMEHRYSLIYSSKGNIVDVKLAPGTHRRFILKYEAVGCPNPVLPAHTYMVRNGSRASVHCNNSSNIWHIVCKGTQWVGTITNCTMEKHAQTTSTGKEADRNLESFGLIIAVFIGVLIGGICGFAMLVLVMMVRKRRKRMYDQRLANSGISSKECPTYGVFSSSHCSAQSLATGTNYTHIWRLQRQNTQTDQYQQQSERMLTNATGSISEVDRAEPDYETRPIPAVTYICRHNKNYEKPVPQIISDSQQLNTHSVNRNRLWSPQCRKETILGECHPDINDSGIET